MLRAAHDAGAAAALARFRVKEAGLLGVAKDIGRGLVGDPLQVAREGMKTFAPGGTLHWEQVLWPKIPGRPVLSRLGQAGTVLSALPVLSALRGGGDPNKGRLSNVLGAAGGALGTAYGFPAAGVLGGSMLARAGTSLGHGLGHLLGSRPRAYAPPSDPQDSLAMATLPPGGL
jgi:hypothetical protein